MSDIGEAIGTVAEGGLLAGAVDKAGTSREKGERSPVTTDIIKGHFAEKACLNCGTELVGAHCHSCGQKAHLHRTIGAFLHDILHGALHFDGKTWRTLPKLIFKPGKLTRRYIDGERARFVSPIALFLFSIFLMFAVFQIAGISTPTNLSQNRTGEVMTQAREQIATMQDRRAKLAASIEAGEQSDEEVAAAQAELKALDDQIEAIEAAEEIPGLRGLLREQDDAGEDAATDIPVETDAASEATIVALDSDSSDLNVNITGLEFIDEGIVQKWRSNPGLMLYKLQTNFYKFSWLLIPLSIPFVWLLFAWKRRFKAYDHAIFVTYSLSFMTLLILTVTLLGLAGAHEIIIFFSSVLIPPIHIYKHLRGAYGLSRFSALWRLAAMSIFILVILTLFLQLLLVLGAF